MSVAAVVTRLSASLEGTGPVFLQLAAFAVIAVGVAGAVREAARWYAAWDDDDRDAGGDAARDAAAQDAPAATPATAPAMPDAGTSGARTPTPARRPGVPPRIHDRLRAFGRRHRSAARRHAAPRATVLALADAGTAQADIARRTGLSRDAVALAIALRR